MKDSDEASSEETLAEREWGGGWGGRRDGGVRKRGAEERETVAMVAAYWRRLLGAEREHGRQRERNVDKKGFR